MFIGKKILEKKSEKTISVVALKHGISKTSTCGGGIELFSLKKVFKVVETFNNVRWKVWLNANFLAYFSCPRSCNFFTNFNLKLKNFVFLTFPIFWKSPYFAQNQFPLFVWVVLQIKCLQAYFEAFDSYFPFLEKQINFCKRWCYLKEVRKYILKIRYFDSQGPKVSK